MAIYEKPVKDLMKEFAEQELSPGKAFTIREAQIWFEKNYPKINPNTVYIHVRGMSVNNIDERKHHKNIKPGSGHDLFFKIDKKNYRLWDPANDPEPLYDDFKDTRFSGSDEEFNGVYEYDEDGSCEFAYEHDLRNYLAKNLKVLEAGLALYEEDGITGIEYLAGGRRIDILAVDKDDSFVVIELKVSRGYDRVVGQLLRYTSWVKKNLADGKPVRGIIVANEITEDLKLATSEIPNVKLFEYQISFQLTPIST